MILVTGATGHVGEELVRLLAGADEPVRAMTRRPDAVSVPAGVTAVYGDAEDPASLETAFAGVHAAFLMSSQAVGAAAEPTHDFALARAAARAGVRRVVKLSVLDAGASGDATGAVAAPGVDPIGRWHTAAEAAVTAPEHGFAWTLLRPGRFMSNALQWAHTLRERDEVPVPFADRPAAGVDPADIAAVAALALTAERGDEHAGAAYRLSGPQCLTPAQELSVLGDALGRDLRLVEVPTEAARAGMARYGMPPEVIDAVMRRTLHSDSGTEVLPTVQKLLGRPARTFAEWARAHADAFS